MPIHLFTILAALPALLLAATAGAQQDAGGISLAEESPPRVIEDRLRFEIGAFGAMPDTTLRLDPSVTQQGTVIGAEDDLALADFKLTPHLELTLLPGDRHFIRLGSLTLRRSAQSRLTRNVVFEDETYQVNERVDSTLDLSLFGLSYGYQFVRRDNFTLAASFGIKIAEIAANAQVIGRIQREAETGVAPVPLLGIEARSLLNDRWSLEGRVQYLSVDIDDVSGSILDARIAALWRFNPHLAAGLGYRHFSIEVDSLDAGTPGMVDLTLSGPVLFLQASL